MNPKVSIIICTYNREGYIRKAIDSALKQSFQDWELLVVDDASQDNTENIVKKYARYEKRIQYVKNERNLGIVGSRNRGVSLVWGNYIAMLDSDDYWIDDDKLSKQVNFLDNNPEVALVGTAIQCISEQGENLYQEIYATTDKEIRRRILLKNQFAQSTVMFRKDVFHEVGEYDSAYEGSEDFDLWLKMGEKYKFVNLADVSTAYMINSQGISLQRKADRVKMAHAIIKKHKKNYPNYLLAWIKSMLRFIKLAL